MRAADQTTGQKTRQEDNGRTQWASWRGEKKEKKTTGRLGQPQPATGALVPGRNKPYNTRNEKVSKSAAATQRGSPLGRLEEQVHPGEEYPQEKR